MTATTQQVRVVCDKCGQERGLFHKGCDGRWVKEVRTVTAWTRHPAPESLADAGATQSAPEPSRAATEAHGDDERVRRHDRYARVLVDNGAAAGSSIHSWRCEHPDRYDPCDCVDELVMDLLAVVDDELNEQAKTRASGHEGELVRLRKRLAESAAVIEHLQAVEFVHSGCAGLREKDNAYLIARAEAAEAKVARVHAVVDGKAGGFAQAVRDALRGGA